jgi:hypothetical protein
MSQNPMGLHIQDDLASLPFYCEFERKRRERECSELVGYLQTIPIEDDHLKRLCQLGPDFQSVISNHPGFSLEQKLNSLWLSVDLFLASSSALKTDFHRFTGFTPTSRSSSNYSEFDLIARSVQKEIFTFCSLASVLKAQAYRVRGILPGTEFNDQCSVSFDVAEHSFVTQLRNVLNHERMVEAKWKIIYSFPGKRTTFELETAELLSLTSLKQDARSYLILSGKKIDVPALIDSYAQRVAGFYSWLRARIEQQLPLEVADYRRCVQAHKRFASRTVWNVLLRNAFNSGIDPYHFLEKYLNVNQLAEVNALPYKSLEQVERIIQLVDHDRCCDADLRQLVFKLFGIHD